MSLEFRKVNIIDEEKHEKAWKAGIRAFVDITLNDAQEVDGFKVCDHGKGLWVSFPSQRSEIGGKKVYRSTWRFTKEAYNEHLREDILKKYKAVKAGELVAKEIERVF